MAKKHQNLSNSKRPKIRRRVYDEAWKKVLDLFFWDFLDFYFPSLSIQIDKKRGYIFLDQELEKIAPQAKSKRRRLDRLARVFLKDKGEVWILIHVEVQTSPDISFAERMFSYYYRIYDRYQKPLASLAILGDSRKSYRPKAFDIEALGKVFVHFEFITSKLLDWKGNEDKLRKMENPFALVTLASLKARQKDLRKRLDWKIGLTSSLYERGYSEEMIKGLYWFLDGIMVLPNEMEIEYNDKIMEIEEEKKMPYITTAERIGIQKGLLEGIESLLEVKFGKEGLQCMERICKLDNLEQSRRLLEITKKAANLNAIKEEIQAIETKLQTLLR